MPGRLDECPSCHADVHACRNCRHHDRSAQGECREPLAEPPREKDRANFCDYFLPGVGAGPVAAGAARQDLLAAADALFRKK